MKAPPERYCDIVMKGGITSGVVYPRAVTELAKTYTLKSVGGTSAGAIAAAAAAELGRLRGARDGEFSLLAGLPKFLGETNASGHANLFTFFQPQPETRRLFNVLAAALNAETAAQRTRRAVAALLRQFWWATLLGALPGLGLVWLAWQSSAGLLTAVTLVLGLALAAFGAVAFPALVLVRQASNRLPRNFFGLCTGMTGTSKAGTALSVWLTGYLNRLAGFDPEGEPLTFGQLWAGSGGASSAAAEAGPAIHLEMMTTCLTWGRPFRLPFKNEESARENRFYFKVSEFEKLFPKPVVKWLCEHPRPTTRLPEKWRQAGYAALPEPADLPVVVATRMSLSFPVLLSAIPLYAYEMEATEAERESQPPRRCWFSDGGICSNFPMHFFDSPLPRWPTFAINLVPRPDNTPASELARPWMPPANSSGIQETWNDFDAGPGAKSVFGFLGAIIGTMQNWMDSSQMRLPGYRDRIAHVGLTSEEGGLNLDMPDTRINHLSERGEAAAKELVRRFASGTEPKMNWNNHRWLRLRSLLASVEEMLERVDRSCARPVAADVDFETWVKDSPVGKAPSYQWDNQTQRGKALKTLRALRCLSRLWQRTAPDGSKVSAGDGAPRPRPELRPRPRT